MNWISVKDRLPQPDVKVWIAYDEPFYDVMDKETHTGIWSSENERWEFYSEIFMPHHKEALRVTHWTHLLEPPKE